MKDMNEKYSIKEVSEILQIPKSTLRYWESEHLIQLDRNETNDYREYTLKQIIDLSDIAFYRSLDVSVTKLKRIYKTNKDDLYTILNETQIGIDNQYPNCYLRESGYFLVKIKSDNSRCYKPSSIQKANQI